MIFLLDRDFTRLATTTHRSQSVGRCESAIMHLRLVGPSVAIFLSIIDGGVDELLLLINLLSIAETGRDVEQSEFCCISAIVKEGKKALDEATCRENRFGFCICSEN